jgi:hypothetical protein
MARKVVASKNQGMGMPLIWTAVLWLLSDRFQWSGFGLGVAVTITGLLWLVWLVSVFTDEAVDIFKEKQ